MFSGNGNSKVSPTYGRTNGLTWVGARDACASKKYLRVEMCSENLKSLCSWSLTNSKNIFGIKTHFLWFMLVRVILVLLSRRDKHFKLGRAFIGKLW